MGYDSFQFLGIPPKGEQAQVKAAVAVQKFPISRDPPEGGTPFGAVADLLDIAFPISRDPPEGGTPPIVPFGYLWAV